MRRLGELGDARARVGEGVELAAIHRLLRREPLVDVGRSAPHQSLDVRVASHRQRLLEHLDEQLERPVLARLAEHAGQRLVVGRLGAAAARAGEHLLGVRRPALGAVTQEPGPLRAVLDDGADPTEDELLRADPDAIAVGKRHRRPLHGAPVDAETVAAAEVLDHRFIPGNSHLCVLSRHERILDGDMALRAAA